MYSFFKSKKNITDLFPVGFVDIHSHILPSIDDGAKSWNETFELLKRMRDLGICNFILTPHIMEGVWENTSEIILTKLEELKSRLMSEGIHDVNIRAAAEYMLDANFMKLVKMKDLLTLKCDKVLVEMSYINPPLNLYEMLFDLQIAGYQPVLAHPERYSYYHQSFEEYDKLKEAGCLFQMNLLSLSTYYGKAVQKTAKRLLKENKIDFVGTDIHHHRHLDAIESINNSALLKLVIPILEKNLYFVE